MPTTNNDTVGVNYEWRTICGLSQLLNVTMHFQIIWQSHLCKQARQPEQSGINRTENLLESSWQGSYPPTKKKKKHHKQTKIILTDQNYNVNITLRWMLKKCMFSSPLKFHCVQLNICMQYAKMATWTPSSQKEQVRTVIPYPQFTFSELISRNNFYTLRLLPVELH